MLIGTALVITALIIITKLFVKLSTGRCTSSSCLVGKTVLITGANSGIGYQTAMILAGRGCRLIIADKDNCDQTETDIMNETGNTNIVTKQFDLASLRSIRCLAEDINKTESRLDILINNAGATGLGNSYSEDGLHIGMQVNHFGSFLLTHLLIKLMKESQSARIIFVSSIKAYFAYLTLENLNVPSSGSPNIFSELFVYSNAKLCNTITANQFAQKLEGTGITVNSVHPGIIMTPLFYKFATLIGKSKWMHYTSYYSVSLFTKTILEGAEAVAHLALAINLEKVTGKFFIDCRPAVMPCSARNTSFSKKIWEASESYVQLSTEEKL